jgi:cytochrome c peroxidase
MKISKFSFNLALIFFSLASLATVSVGFATTGLMPLGDFIVSNYDFGIPSWAPTPLEPKGNPTTKAKTELVRHLFYDKRLSVDGSMSCASCHKQELAFTDGLTVSVGSTGEKTARNAMSLVNSAYFPTMTWSHPSLFSPEQQALIPLLGATPPELGLHNHEQEA